MIIVRSLTLLMLTVLCAAGASAQSETQLREGELNIDIDIRFISSYRDGSWVPVDIIVNNNKRDIDGYLEVTAIQAGMPQPPAYRVPVDSPKGSRKRFRLYCLLDGTTDLEAMLYRGSRPELAIPMKVALRPISQIDYLCLILDKEPADYGYLYSAVLDGTTDQGFYRIELKGDELGALPDRLPCFESIDLIVMGDIDPDDVSRRHRALITRYVENGGTLIICGGANTAQYRGTWAEELAGVSMGSQQIVNEREFAAMAFLAPSTDRLRDTKQGEFTPLTPKAEGVVRWGNDAALATLRPVGNGYVGVVSLDMASKLLHTTAEYEAMWTQLAGMRTASPEINFGVTSSFLREQLPNVAGVRVFPRSSVAAYLTIYLLVAIIGNWVFWSFLKRREMAWVCLVFFSIGFTAYAMVYGTAGRAKETELEQINIVRVYDHTSVAKVHSTIGLLSARSARYSFELADAAGLVSQGAFAYSGMYRQMGGSSRRNASGEFAFVEGTRPRVDNLRVGASVMRTLQVESELTLAGGIEGTLTHDEEGLHGTLINKTGLRIQEPFVYYLGRTIRAKMKPGTDEIEVKLRASRFDSPHLTAAPSNPNYMYPGSYGYGMMSVQSAIREPLMSLIFVSPDGMTSMDTSLGPYVYGWATASPPSAVNLEEDVKLKIRETMVIADIKIEGSEAKLLPRSLVVEVNGARANVWRGQYYRDWSQLSHHLNWEPRRQNASNQLPVEIDIPRDVAARAQGDLTLDLQWTTEREQIVRFVPEDVEPDWVDANTKMEKPIAEDVLGTRVKAMRYRVKDWRDHYDESAGVIRGHVALIPDKQAQKNRNAWAQFSLKAHLEVLPMRVTSEEWKAWP